MFKKVLLIVSMLMLVLAIGTPIASADGGDEDDEEVVVENCLFYNEDEDVTVPGYCDGRLNTFDILQPVAIYYSFDTVTAWDDDGNPYATNAVTGVEVWVPDAEGVGQLGLRVPVDEITAAFAATGDVVQIAAANGITLSYLPAGHLLWVAVPGYNFTWEAW
jgi:hypothetical protein